MFLRCKLIDVPQAQCLRIRYRIDFSDSDLTWILELPKSQLSTWIIWLQASSNLSFRIREMHTTNHNRQKIICHVAVIVSMTLSFSIWSNMSLLTDPNNIWTIGYMLICSSHKVQGGTQPSRALSLTRVWFRPVGSQMRHGTYCHTCPSQRRSCIIILHFWEELSVGKLKVWKSGEGELCQLTLNIITNKQSLVAKSQNDSNVRPPSVSTEQNQGLARPWALQWQSRRVRRGD